MDEHPIQGLMTTAMENLKDMTEVNTIIGDPVESPDGSVIIPVSKLGFGFAAGGSEFNGSSSSGESGSGDSSDSLPFGGGSGGGVSVTPVAFLIVNPKGIKMIHLDESTHIYEKMMDFAPKAVEKIQQLLKESGLPDMMKQQQQSGKSEGKQKQGDQQQEKKRRQDHQHEQDSQKFDDDFDQSYDI